MNINFEKSNGLIPVVTQDADTSEILMVAFVNQDAFQMTVKTGKACYFSRSKNRIWIKGEESGNYQEIVDILIDCDEDAIVYKVRQQGLKASCHTGRYSCFYRHFVDGEWVVNDVRQVFDPETVYKNKH
jgi:phosphoribosyl-AMP cyclohydrolase